MHSEGWQPPGQLDVLDLGVDLAGSHELAVLLEDPLLNLVVANVRLRQEFLQAREERKEGGNVVDVFVVAARMEDATLLNETGLT